MLSSATVPAENPVPVIVKVWSSSLASMLMFGARARYPVHIWLDGELHAGAKCITVSISQPDYDFVCSLEVMWNCIVFYGVLTVDYGTSIDYLVIRIVFLPVNSYVSVVIGVLDRISGVSPTIPVDSSMVTVG